MCVCVCDRGRRLEKHLILFIFSSPFFLLARVLSSFSLFAFREGEKDERTEAIVADWTIDKRLSSRDAFFPLVLVVDWRKINASRWPKRALEREKQRMRERGETRERENKRKRKHSRKIIVREESKTSRRLRLCECNFR